MSGNPTSIQSQPEAEGAPSQAAAAGLPVPQSAVPTARTDTVVPPPMQNPSGFVPQTAQAQPVQPQYTDIDPWSGARLPPGFAPPQAYDPWQNYVPRQPVIGAQPSLQAPWPQPALADQWRAFIPVPEPPPQRTGGVGAPMLPRDQTQSAYPPAPPPGVAHPGPVRSDPSIGYGRPPRGQPFVGAFGHQPEHGGRQNVHDIPPTWDGQKPETQLEPYLKALRGWMLTTRTLKAQRGYVIVQYSQGELKQLLNYFDLDTLFSENGAEHCFNFCFQNREHQR